MNKPLGDEIVQPKPGRSEFELTETESGALEGPERSPCENHTARSGRDMPCCRTCFRHSSKHGNPPKPGEGESRTSGP